MSPSIRQHDLPKGYSEDGKISTWSMKLSIDLSINCTYFQPNFGIAQYVIQTKCTKLGECLFLSSEVALGRAEAAVDTRHALHLAVRHIVVELLV